MTVRRKPHLDNTETEDGGCTLGKEAHGGHNSSATSSEARVLDRVAQDALTQGVSSPIFVRNREHPHHSVALFAELAIDFLSEEALADQRQLQLVFEVNLGEKNSSVAAKYGPETLGNKWTRPSAETGQI